MNAEVLLSFLISIPTWVMLLPIGICSIFLLAVFIERMIFFQLVTVQFTTRLPAFKEELFAQKAADRASYAEKSPHFVRELILSFLSAPKSTNSHKVLEEKAHRLIRMIERFLGLVSTIATISPMFGLLGTVTGMMKSFSALSTTDAAAQTMLALGIAEALVTTATGLLVAIPAVVLYNYMVSRSKHLIAELEIFSNSLLEQ